MNSSDDNYYFCKYQKYKSKYQKLLNNNKSSFNRVKNKFQSDIDEILDSAQHVKILGMAEATHGQNQITKFRMRVFKQLVKKHGYTVFVLEDQYSCCEQINQYIHTGHGKPADLIMRLSWFWASVEMLKLIKWMRKYNQKHNNILEFKGLDIQSICEIDATFKDEVFQFVIKKNKDNERIDQMNWVEADGFRDKSMFQVFMKIYDPEKKYFLYAHNYHIARQDLIGSGVLPPDSESEGRFVRDGESVDWLGCLLSKKFDNQYLAIGNVFTNGYYLETFDLIEQNQQSGIKTIFDMYKDSDIYIVVGNIPSVGRINSDALPEGLTWFDQFNREFDAIMKITYETPLEIIH